MKRHDNRGFSLVEIIVTIAIAAVVAVALLSFLGISVNQYHSSNAETSVQYEAQLANNQLHDMLIDVTAGLSYKEGTDGEAAVRKLYFFDWDDSSGEKKNIVSIVTWNSADKELKYVSYEYTGTEISAAEESNSMLMAEYVTDFSVALPADTTSRSVSYSLTFEKDGHTYTTQNTVTLRNNVAINDSEINKIFDDIQELKSTVTSVTVSPAAPAPLLQGKSMVFSAKVNGENWPSQKVIWSLSDDTALKLTDPDNTSINSATGEITLGAKETCQSIEVVATSVKSLADNNNNADEAVKGSAIVTTRYMESVSLIRMSSGNGMDQTAKLEFTGKNFPAASEFTPTIEWSYSHEGVSADMGSLTTGVQGEGYSYDTVEISCDGTVPYETNVTVTAKVTYGPFTKTVSFDFNTGRKKDPVTEIRICDDAGNILGNNTAINRGATQNLNVWTKRSGAWTPASTDVSVSWTYSYDNVRGSYTNYATWPGYTDGSDTTMSGMTGYVTAKKDPEALPYSSSYGRVRVDAAVTDLEGGGAVLVKETEVSVNVVTVSLGPTYSSDGYSVETCWGGKTALTGSVSGIELSDSDVYWDSYSYYGSTYTSSISTAVSGNRINGTAVLKNYSGNSNYYTVKLIISAGTTGGSYSSGGVYSTCYLNIHNSNVYDYYNRSKGYYVQRNLPSSTNTNNQYVAYDTFTLSDGTSGSYEYYSTRYGSRKYVYYYININGTRYLLSDKNSNSYYWEEE